MLFKTFGDTSLPVVVLLHGGGLSWWSWQKEIDLLRKKYCVVTPVIDGHAEDGAETFVSIEDSAEKLIDYLEKNHNGRVFAIGGLSIGAQITAEVLSRKAEIARYAVLESALVFPIKSTGGLTVPAVRMTHGLVKQKWFSKLQAKALFVPQDQFERYYQDSLNISKESLINITVSNGNYQIKSGLRDTKARVSIIVGEREIGIMKKSAEALHHAIPQSELHLLDNMGHGEISLVYPDQYLKLLSELLADHEKISFPIAVPAKV